MCVYLYVCVSSLSKNPSSIAGLAQGNGKFKLDGVYKHWMHLKTARMGSAVMWCLNACLAYSNMEGPMSCSAELMSTANMFLFLFIVVYFTEAFIQTNYSSFKRNKYKIKESNRLDTGIMYMVVLIMLRDLRPTLEPCKKNRLIRSLI